MPSKTQNSKTGEASSKRKPYASPSLSTYGSFEHLTMGGGGIKGDGGPATMA